MATCCTGGSLHKVRIASLPVDDAGAVPAALGAGGCSRAAAHQYPLGMTLAPGRRARRPLGRAVAAA
jgi:hypothetical protein